MEQVLTGFSGMADAHMLEWLAAICLIFLAVAMALFDLPGNTLMAGCCLGFAFYDPSKYFDIRIISAVILIYALGEICDGVNGVLDVINVYVRLAIAWDWVGKLFFYRPDF